MYRTIFIIIILSLASCKEASVHPTDQEIVDKSIELSGGKNYLTNEISFHFRNKEYISKPQGKQKILMRRSFTDTTNILDVKSPNNFQRFVNDSLVILADTTANAYANAVNSVHYFAYLPYGLNDKAVQKKFLGTSKIGSSDYYKIEVTFSKNGGGDDFDDVYVYWFNTVTFEPDYLAYEFQVNGGGQRFRVAFNERVVEGIRFVDYKNYKAKNSNVSIENIDVLYTSSLLELLSEIKLENIKVIPGNYN